MTTASGHTQAITATRVIGTSVRNNSGESIGKVEDIMLDKLSNQVQFAIISFGGFLGMGEKYHPVPWSLLDYDKQGGHYVVPFTKDQLKTAPASSLEELTKGDGKEWRDSAYTYYKTPKDWQ